MGNSNPSYHTHTTRAVHTCSHTFTDGVHTITNLLNNRRNKHSANVRQYEGAAYNGTTRARRDFMTCQEVQRHREEVLFKCAIEDLE